MPRNKFEHCRQYETISVNDGVVDAIINHNCDTSYKYLDFLSKTLPDSIDVHELFADSFKECIDECDRGEPTELRGKNSHFQRKFCSPSIVGKRDQELSQQDKIDYVLYADNCAAKKTIKKIDQHLESRSPFTPFFNHLTLGVTIAAEAAGACSPGTMLLGAAVTYLVGRKCRFW